MLEIAKVTFPHEFWENPRADMHCKHSTSSADKLACAWREVLSTLRSSRNGPPPAEMILPFLVYVCHVVLYETRGLIGSYSFARLLKSCSVARQVITTSLAYSLVSALPQPVSCCVCTNRGAKSLRARTTQPRHSLASPFYTVSCNSRVVMLKKSNSSGTGSAQAGSSFLHLQGREHPMSCCSSN
jgi:hypothetical protein